MQEKSKNYSSKDVEIAISRSDRATRKIIQNYAEASAEDFNVGIAKVNKKWVLDEKAFNAIVSKYQAKKE